MKRRFLVLLSAIFALAAIALIVVQVIQTRQSASMSDNLFNISVNNAMDNVVNQLEQLKLEDYVNQKQRYKIARFRRVEDLNDKMMDIIRENSDLFYDETRIRFGVSMQDSAFVIDGKKISDAETNTINQYNTLLNASKRITQNEKADLGNIYEEINSAKMISSVSFNYGLLDSLTREELILNGVEVRPSIGVLAPDQDSLLYVSDSSKMEQLLTSTYRYSFLPYGSFSRNQIHITLSFPDDPFFSHGASSYFILMSIVLIVIIIATYLFSVRAILSQRKLDIMKTDFINNMTHEIKTPIATISLACEMLQDKELQNDAATQNNFINIISDENRRMRMLIETILQSAKMGNRNFSLNLKEFDLNDAIRETVHDFQLSVSKRNGTITTDLQCAPANLFADQLHISNMIHNLIDNAIKYSDTELFVLVRTHAEGGNVVLEVTDHGIGIAKEDQKHIFEKFYRVSTGNIHNVKGFGIGLNYVAQVVKLHHGTIGIESEPDHGTTFRIVLPLA